MHVPTNLNNLKGKANELDVDKLVPVNSSNLNDVIKNGTVKKYVVMVRLIILKIKYMMLLT